MARRSRARGRTVTPGGAAAALLVLLPPLAIAHRAQSQDPAARVTAIVNATVIDVREGRRRPGMVVLVTGERIGAVGPAGRVSVPPHARVFDAGGGYLIPGLMDTHVHLAEQWERQPADTLALLAWIVATGVTTVRDMGSAPLEANLNALAAAGETGAMIAPRIVLAASPDSGLIARVGATNRRDALQRFAARGIQAVKVLGHPRDTALAIIADGRAAGLPVVGHTLALPGPDGRAVNFTMDAVRVGMSGVSHVHAALFPLAPQASDTPPSLSRFTPEGRRAWTLYSLTAWRRVDERDLSALVDTMIARQVWFEPTLTAFRFRAERYDSAALARYWTWQRQPARPADREVDPAAGEQLDAGDRFVRRFHAAGGLIVAGSEIPVPPLGVPEELRLLRRAGLSPAAALQAATINAARALGLDDRLGVIETGRLAELVLLDADPLQDIGNVRRVRTVVINGRVLDRAALDAVLARVGTPIPPSAAGR